MAMTFPTDSRTLSRITAWTVDDILPGVREQAYDVPGTLQWLEKHAGVKKPWNGSDQIGIVVQLEKSPAGDSMPAFGTVDFTVPNVETRAQFTPKAYPLGLALSIIELQRMDNDQSVADYTEHRTRDAVKKLRDLLGGTQGIHGDGTTGTDDWVGLKGLFATDQTTGTWGGVSRANTNWRAKVTDNNQTTADVLEDLRTTATLLEDGEDMAEVVITNRLGRNIYESKLTSVLETDPLVIGSRGRSATGDAGIGHLAYRGIPMLVDVNMSLVVGSNTAWHFLNTGGGRYMNLHVHPDADYKFMGFQESEDQLLLKGKLLWHGVFSCGVLRRQGTVEDGPAS